MKSFFFLFLPGYVLSTSAQTTVPVFCKVTDENNTPIPYAIIEFKKTGAAVMANEKGHFTINIPERLIESPLQVSALGFQKEFVQVMYILSDSIKEIRLETKNRVIKETAIQRERSKVVQVGVKEKKEGRCSGLIGSQVAVYIANPNHEAGILRKVSFYVDNQGLLHTPFRVRVYSADPVHQSPGEDLLTKNVVLRPQKGNTWVTIDLSEYHITLPENGFFVAMEWVYTNDDFLYTDGETASRCYGQKLGVTMGSSCHTWNYRLGGEMDTGYFTC